MRLLLGARNHRIWGGVLRVSRCLESLATSVFQFGSVCLEANMTVANVIEIVVVLAILYAAYRFFQKRG